MLAGFEQPAGVADADAGADRQAAAEPLGQRDDVRPIPADWWANQAPVRPIPVCTSSITSSAPRAAVISPRGAQVALGRHDHAGLAEDRLEDDRGRVGVDRGVQRGGVAVGHVRHPWRQRLERRPLGLAGR